MKRYPSFSYRSLPGFFPFLLQNWHHLVVNDKSITLPWELNSIFMSIFRKKLFHWPLPWPMLHGCIPRIQNEVKYKTLSLNKLFLTENKKCRFLIKLSTISCQWKWRMMQYKLAGWQWVFPVHFPFAYYLFISENNRCMNVWFGELLRHKKGIQ